VSGDILSHTPGLRDRQLAVLRQWRDTLEPFADDPQLPLKVRRQIARVNFELGVMHARAGHFAESAESYSAAAARLEGLAAAEPNDPSLQVDLADAYQALSRVLACAGRFAESDAMMAAALPPAERGQRGLPDESQPLVLLTMIRCALADAEERRTGASEAVLSQHLGALKVYERLRDRYRTGHPQSYMRLARLWIVVARIYERMGRLGDAERAWRLALEYDEHLVREFAHEPATVRDGSRSARAGLGLCLIRQGRADEGEPLFDDGIRELEQAARDFPDDFDSRSEIAEFNYNLAHFRHQQGRPDAARRVGQGCLELVRKAPPGFPRQFRVRALVLLPSPNLRDPSAAARVLAEDQGVVDAWVRAAVLWRSGQPAEALDLASGGTDPAAGFIQAACLAQLGRADEARRAYDRAVQRLRAPQICILEVVSLQQEVAAHLAATLPHRP
jgi:tetratricopeptide (TPR) repeat protein